MLELIQEKEFIMNLSTGVVLLAVEVIFIIVLLPLAIHRYDSFRWRPMALKMMDSLAYHSILCSEEVIKIGKTLDSSKKINDDTIIKILTELGNKLFEIIYRLDDVVSAYFFRVDYKYAKEIADCRAYMSGYAELMRTIPPDTSLSDDHIAKIESFAAKVDDFMQKLGAKYGSGNPPLEKVDVFFTVAPTGRSEDYILFDFPNLSLGITKYKFEKLYKIDSFVELVKRIRDARVAQD